MMCASAVAADASPSYGLVQGSGPYRGYAGIMEKWKPLFRLQGLEFGVRGPGSARVDSGRVVLAFPNPACITS